MKKTNNFLVGLLAGVAAGAAVALLLAPKRGKEMREAIGGRTNDLRGRAADITDDLRGRAGDIRGRASDIRERAQRPISSVRDRLRRRDSEPSEESLVDLGEDSINSAAARDSDENA